MSRTYRRRDYGGAFLAVFLLAIFLSPLWLVAVLGILAPAWIAWSLMVVLVTGIGKFFTRK